MGVGSGGGGEGGGRGGGGGGRGGGGGGGNSPVLGQICALLVGLKLVPDVRMFPVFVNHISPRAFFSGRCKRQPLLTLELEVPITSC